MALHLGVELRCLEHFATKAAAWIQDYNTTRKHSARGMRSPSPASRP